MNKTYKNILSPFTLNDRVVLKNRLSTANGQQALTQGPEDFPADNTMEEMIVNAAAGAGIVCFTHYGTYGAGAAMPDQTGLSYTDERAHFQKYDYDQPKILNLLTQYATIVHMYGAKAIVRLGSSRISWPQGKSYLGGDKGMFPVPKEYTAKYGSTLKFAPRNPATGQGWKERCASKEEIQAIIDGVVEECKKYKSTGFDGISYRCDRYLDAATNIREDEYGGEIENRGRFLLELFTKIKETVGEDFLIEADLMADSDHGHDAELPHGYTLEEAIRFLKMVEPVIDIVQLRERLNSGYQCLSYNSSPGVHPVLEHARTLRESGFAKAIAVNGGFTRPDDMEEALESGACDIIASARSFLADPEFVRKISDGEWPTPCLRCNKCHHHIHDLWITGCSVNPKASLNHRLNGVLSKAPRKCKKVAVIGGGPVGMRAACYAAERGHQVTIFEKTGYLGGKTKHADLYPFKWTIKEYRLWLIEEVNRLGIEVRLNTEPVPEELTEEGFDAVIACTGSVAKRPPIEGAENEGVWTAEDVYEQRAQLGEKIVLVGGAEVATDTAVYLADCGKDITVITRNDTLMKREQRPGGLHNVHEVQFEDLGYGTLAPIWGIYDNLTPVFQAVTTKVTPNSVTYVKDGREETITCDSVIVTGGYSPCIADALKYGNCAKEFYLAGDVQADRPGNLQQGNLSALGTASIL